jgi:hypothetical protein
MRTYITFLLIISSGFLVSCQNKMYRELVPSSGKEIKMNPYGAYTELTSDSGELLIGEALALQEDTLFLLGAQSVLRVSITDIQKVKLILTRNAGNKYLTAAALMCIPAVLGAMAHSDYAGSFAIVALVTFGFGALAAGIESMRKSEIKTYSIRYPIIVDFHGEYRPTWTLTLSKVT